MIVGHVPNLPWWRCLSMTDVEIKEFNNKHLTEIEMIDDSLDDVVNYCSRCDKFAPVEHECLVDEFPFDSEVRPIKMIDKALEEFSQYRYSVGKPLCRCHLMDNSCEVHNKLKIVGIDRALAPSVFETEIWNKAIEAAIKTLDAAQEPDISYWIEEIRKLKK